MPAETVGAAIDAHRKHNNLSVLKLARAAGISRSHLYNVINGDSTASDSMLEKIAQPLGVTAYDLRNRRLHGEPELTPQLAAPAQQAILQSLAQRAAGLEHEVRQIQRVRAQLEQVFTQSQVEFDLRFVRVDEDSIALHEQPSPGKIRRLRAKYDREKDERKYDQEVRDEGQDDERPKPRPGPRLRDPVVLAKPKAPGEPMLQLDGATRIEALRAWPCRHIVAQVVDLDSPLEVALETWLHLVNLKCSQRSKKRMGDAKTDFHIPPDVALRRLAEDADVCAVAIHFNDRGKPTSFIARTPTSTPDLDDRVRALRSLVEAYSDKKGPRRRAPWGPDLLSRVIELLNYYRDDREKCLVFKPFSKDEIRELAEQRLLIPHGISRFILPKGRVLRVNTSLEDLAKKASAATQTKRLREWMRSEAQRPFTDPVILLGEGD